jgi:hypothetical protein
LLVDGAQLMCQQRGRPPSAASSTIRVRSCIRASLLRDPAAPPAPAVPRPSGLRVETLPNKFSLPFIPFDRADKPRSQGCRWLPADQFVRFGNIGFPDTLK